MAERVRRKKTRDFILILGGILLAADAFGLDLLFPLDMAIGVPYALVVLLGLWWPGRGYILTAAIAGSLLCLLGFYFSYEAETLLSKAVINRGLALFVIWMVTVLCLSHKRNQSKKVEFQQLVSQIGLLYSQVQDPSKEFPLFKQILDSLLSFTESQFGVIGEVLENSEGRPYLEKRAGIIRNSIWKQPTGLGYEEPPVSAEIEIHSLRHLLDEVVNTGKPLLIAYSSEEISSGPSKQPDMESFLGLPLYHEGELLAVVGIANRPHGYDEALVDYLQPLLAACAEKIRSFDILRVQEREHRLLKENENRLQAMETDRDRLQSEVKEKDTRLDRLSEELKQAEDILQDKEAALAVLVREQHAENVGLSGVQESLTRLQQELENARTALGEKDAQIAKVRGERNRAEGLLWDKEERLIEVQKALDELEQRIKEKIDRSDRAETELKQAQDQLTQKESRLAEIEGRAMQVQTELLEKEKLVAEIEVERVQAERRSEENNNRFQQMEMEKNRIEKELHEAQVRLEQAQVELREKEQVLSDRDAQFDHVESQEKKFQETFREQADRLAQLQSQRDRLEQTSHQQEDHLNALLNEAQRASNELKHGQDRLNQMQRDMGLSQKALHASEERFRQVAENLEEWIWEIDASGRFTYSNRAVEKILGYTAKELVGNHYFYDLFDPDSKEELKNAVQRVFESKEILRKGMRPYRDRGGRLVKIESSAVPVLDEWEHLLGYRGVSREIPPLAGLGKTARRTEGKKEMFAAKENQGICGLDLNGSISYINPAGARLLGFAPDELVGKNQHDVLHHSRRDGTPYPREECPIHRTLVEGKVSHVVDEAFWRKDDSSISVEYICTPIWEKKRQVGAVVSFAQVPPWKREERMAAKPVRVAASKIHDLEKEPAFQFSAGEKDVEAEKEKVDHLFKYYAGELERSNQELRDFASIASHDLQEPLRKVLGFSERLKRDCWQNLDTRGRDYLERMERSTRRMQQFIEDLLQYSKVSAKPPRPQTVDLNEIMADVLSLLETRIERTHARVTMDPLPTLHADRMQMHQLFQNLIGNALKFHKAGEPPVVRIRHRVLDNRSHEFRVEDQGIGFDECQADRIFKPFERLHGRSEYEGSGIGLSICKKIVERHGGAITVQSAKGKGATFIVTLPEMPESKDPWLADV